MDNEYYWKIKEGECYTIEHYSDPSLNIDAICKETGLYIYSIFVVINGPKKGKIIKRSIKKGPGKNVFIKIPITPYAKKLRDIWAIENIK